MEVWPKYMCVRCLPRKDMLTFDISLIGRSAYEGGGMNLGDFFSTSKP